MQLKNDDHDYIFEWVQYNKLIGIKEIDKGGFAEIYSAIWTYGPLHYNNNARIHDKKVALKYLNNSQVFTSEFLNEVCKFFYEFKLNIMVLITFIMF